MNQTEMERVAEDLMADTLEGGSSVARRNRVYDGVISKFKAMEPLAAAAIAMQLERFLTPHDPDKLKELKERLATHLTTPNGFETGEEEPERAHDLPPGPGPEAVKEALVKKEELRAEVEKTKPQPKIPPGTTKRRIS